MLDGLTMRTLSWTALAVVWSTVSVRDVRAADRLIDQQPYDLLTLKQDAQTLQLVPLEMERRAPLRKKDRGEWLMVQLLNRPEQRYQVHWRDIERVQLFEELVLEEAARLTESGDFDEAHRCYGFIERRAPEFPGLAAARNQSLMREAEHWLGQGQYVNALVLLNELYERDQRYSGLKELSGRVVDRLMEEHLSQRRYAAARDLLDELAAKYASHEVVDVRRRQLMELGQQMYAAAQTAAATGKLREAHELVRTARRVWPDSQPVRQLAVELNRKYPVVCVGVREPWSAQQPGMPVSWAASRCRSLVDRYLFLPQSLGPEGGTYESEIVSSTTDGTQTTLRLNAGVRWLEHGRLVSSLDVGRQIAEGMDLSNSLSCRSLASAVESMRVVDATSLEINWKTTCPLWQTLLQIPIRRGAGEFNSAGNQERLGDYEATSDNEGAWRFTLREAGSDTNSRLPRQISETVYRDTLSALRALRTQEIHVYDRVVPWDVSKVRAYEDLQLVAYAAPTVHLLVPNPNSPRVAAGLIRRGISLALDRQQILRDVLGDGDTAAGKALSGPFPSGYGCDASIEPGERNARLAAAVLNGPLDSPTDRSLTLVHAPDSVARRAAQAMQEQLKLDGVGLDVVLVESAVRDLANGPNQPWDLWYLEWNAMEPLVDAQLLLGPDSVVGRNDPLLPVLVEALQQVTSWDEARAGLHRIHRCVNERLLVIPLWQLDEHAVVHRALQGVGTRPMTLYQNLEQWQVKLE